MDIQRLTLFGGIITISIISAKFDINVATIILGILGIFLLLLAFIPDISGKNKTYNQTPYVKPTKDPMDSITVALKNTNKDQEKEISKNIGNNTNVPREISQKKALEQVAYLLELGVPIEINMNAESIQDIVDFEGNYPYKHIDPKTLKPKDLTIPSEINISYRDSKGKETQRDISIKNIRFHDGVYYLDTYCHMRHASKTFRSDRITEIISNETGEIFTPEVFFSGTLEV